ncbi:MAG: diaminopimelate decarboxylase, partial [Rhodococcus fascians]
MSAHPAGPKHADVRSQDGLAERPKVASDMTALPEHVYPRNAARGDDGVVTLAGVPVTELAEQYGTPLFVIDEDDFRSRAREMAEAFGDPARVHYASKAFLCGEIARWVADEGLSLDICSGGELGIALAAGFPAERIAMHGNNKSVAELTAGVRAGVEHVVLDSM